MVTLYLHFDVKMAVLKLTLGVKLEVLIIFMQMTFVKKARPLYSMGANILFYHVEAVAYFEGGAKQLICPRSKIAILFRE